MKLLWNACVIIAAAILGLSAIEARASTITSQGETTITVPDSSTNRALNSPPYNSKTHMLVMKCTINADYHAESRVVVLNLPQKYTRRGYDVALVSGHGLQGDNNCIIQDFEGRSAAVIDMTLAPNYKAGTAQDWGIVRFKTLKTKSLIRYSLIPQDFSARTFLDVQFAAARGLPQNQQNCRLVMAGEDGGILAPTGTKLHDCYAVPGQSGSPLSRYLGGTDYLMGIHLGRIILYQYPPQKDLLKRGYLRLIDASFIAEITELLKVLHEP